MKFCDRAVRIGKEHEVDFEIVHKVLLLKLLVFADASYFRQVSDVKPPQSVLSLPVAVQQKLEKRASFYLDLAQDYYDLKAQEVAQYELCYNCLKQGIFTPDLQTSNQNQIQHARILQGKALRRIFGVSDVFETTSWSKYTDETAKHFLDLAAYASLRGGAPEEYEKMFKILDVNGIGLVCVTDIAPMLEIILRTEAEEKREAVK